MNCIVLNIDRVQIKIKILISEILFELEILSSKKNNLRRKTLRKTKLTFLLFLT